MRATFVLLHRWFGLFIAVFLFIAGTTGALISWDHELDRWLNPQLYDVSSRGPTLAPLDIAQRVETADARRIVTYLPTQFEEGRAVAIGVEGRRDPAIGKAFELGHNQVFVDPVTGAETGSREWGAISLDRENLLPFLYALHYSLHIPEMWNIDRWGVWLMGVVGIVWLFDCFVGLYLTFPLRRRAAPPLLAFPTRGEEPPENGTALSDGATARSWLERWKPSWRVKWSGSRYRINFDLHRAAGLWFWILLLIVAFTSIAMNLGDEVVRPLVRSVSSVTPSAWDARTPRSHDDPIEAKLGYRGAIAKGEAEARARGWVDPVGYAYYSPEYGIYGIGFHAAGADPHGSGGMGVRTILLDGTSGAILGKEEPWTGTAGDVFLQLQFPIHSGRILGIPGRIAMSVLGLVVAMLSVTGIVIWFKKRASRRLAALRGQPEPEGRLRPALAAATAALGAGAMTGRARLAAALDGPTARRTRAVARQYGRQAAYRYAAARARAGARLRRHPTWQRLNAGARTQLTTHWPQALAGSRRAHALARRHSRRLGVRFTADVGRPARAIAQEQARVVARSSREARRRGAALAQEGRERLVDGLITMLAAIEGFLSRVRVRLEARPDPGE